MIRRSFLFFFCLVVIGWSVPAHAEKVVFYADSLPPYITLHAHGPPTGFAVELLHEVVREAGVEETDVSIELLHWARAVQGVRDVPGTALLCLAQLPERVHAFKWVGPIDFMAVGLFADKAGAVFLKEASDIYRYRIAVIRRTALSVALNAAYPGIGDNLEEVRGIDTQLRMLREGRVDMIAQAYAAVERTMGDHGMHPEDYVLVRRLEPLKMYFGFNKSVSDAFSARLQAALDRLKGCENGGKSRYEQIKAKYFSPVGRFGLTGLLEDWRGLFRRGVVAFGRGFSR